jgi:hypothetical protein
MNKVFLIGGIVCLVGAFCSYTTGQGLGATTMLGFIAGVLLVIGMAGKP